MQKIVVGVSGASGIVLAYRTVVALTSLGYFVELVLTDHACYAATLEMGKEFSTARKFFQKLPADVAEKTHLHPIHDVGASIASGSYSTRGMVIIPCSMTTLASIAVGIADNCLKRAADVTLKERRPLILVPRETPLNAIHLENMLKLCKMGAVILPPVPAWYNAPSSLEDVENFIVGKVLDALGIENQLYKRWC